MQHRSSGSAKGPANTNVAESKLLDSALILFAEKGYEGTSIREIIEGAGVTRPVLYYYFENKEDLFRRLVEMNYESYTTEIRQVLERTMSCEERLKAVIRMAFRLTQENPEAVALIFQVFFSPRQQGPPMDRSTLARKRFRLFEHIMRDGLENGELSGGDAQSLALIFMGIMDMHIMAKASRPQMRLTEELANGLVELFLDGVEHKEHPRTALVSPYAF